MLLGILHEPETETRVSLLPDHLAQLLARKVSILVEAGSGEQSYASDAQYVQAGASISSRKQILETCDLVLSIHPPAAPDLTLLKKDAVLLGVYNPLSRAVLINECIRQGITVFSLDMLPRSTRAQSMDVLSSQANIAGYKAVLLAASELPKYFPMFMTAAGTIPPAKVLVLGAGVAGLQAVATARRLGAVVEVFDTRQAVKEEVMSLGAKFVEVEGAADANAAGGYAVEQSEDYLRRQQARIAEAGAKADVIITTAQIPGKKAPLLIPDSVIEGMKPGSLIIDLASSSGGNTERTKDRETVTYKGVRIIGDSNLAASMPADASRLYGKNVLNFLQLIISAEGSLSLNFEDELQRESCMVSAGEIRSDRVKRVFSTELKNI